ncbi:MAG: asparaginase [Phycisphaerales bacterium]|nr:asparaginase [Phycisphaerales bacterium]
MTGNQARFRVAIISTGGTIEKTYCELGGVLSNEASVLDVMLSQLELEGLEIDRVPLMNKDSTNMSDADHDLVARSVAAQAADHDGIVVVHGTDRLTVTGERIQDFLPEVSVPVVLTGAMRPYELRRTDALQNLVEALMAVQLLQPGVWCVMHNRALRFPGVRKDLERGTFVSGD